MKWYRLMQYATLLQHGHSAELAARASGFGNTARLTTQLSRWFGHSQAKKVGEMERMRTPSSRVQTARRRRVRPATTAIVSSTNPTAPGAAP